MSSNDLQISRHAGWKNKSRKAHTHKLNIPFMNVRTAQLLPTHTAMYACDHAGSHKVVSDVDRKDDQTSQRTSRRIGCPARIK